MWQQDGAKPHSGSLSEILKMTIFQTDSLEEMVQFHAPHYFRILLFLLISYGNLCKTNSNVRIEQPEIRKTFAIVGVKKAASLPKNEYRLDIFLEMKCPPIRIYLL